MTDQLSGTKNQEQTDAAAQTFGPYRDLLPQADRVLICEGILMKHYPHGPQPKVFRLFNDKLVYSNLNGRSDKTRWSIPLGERLDHSKRLKIE